MEALDLDRLVRGEAARVLGAGRIACVWVNGWRLDASRLTALLFAPGSTRPSLVAKVGRGPGKQEVWAERDNLDLLARCGDREFRRSVPHPHGALDTPDVAVLFESVLPGQPMPAAVATGSLDAFADRITEWVLAFHRATAAQTQPRDGSVFHRVFLRPFAEYREAFRPGREEERFLERMQRLAEGWESAGLPLVFLHGDLCPANILVDGPRLGVIDWETPFAAAAPLYDLIHLFACLGPEGGTRDGLCRFRTVFFEDNPLAVTARRALRRYARSLGIADDAMRLLFTTYWLEYALEKHRLGRAPPAGPDREADGGLWGLARFGEGTCLNVRWLAQHEASLQLR